MFERSFSRVGALSAFVVFLAAFASHIDNLDNSLLGWDAYATIIASRIESLADVWGTFSEVMMDGRFPFAAFYRPIGNLLIAVDYAIWDLDPFGYQLTNLVLWALSASLVFVLARRLLGEKRMLGPVVAVLFYVLHPAILSILPFAARRTETLQIIFTLLTLISLPVAEGERRAPRYWLAGLCAALAVGSKETGIVVLPLAFIHQFFLLERRAMADRAIAAFRAIVPAAVLMAGVLAARLAVIGGIGGYYEAAPMSYMDRLLSFAPGYFRTVVVTGAAGRSPAAGPIAFVVLLALISMAVWLHRAIRNRNEDDQRRRIAASGAVGIVWLLGQGGLACLSFQFSPRYLVGMVAGFSLALAALAEGTWIATASGTMANRARIAFAAVVVAVAVIPGLVGSPLWYDYPGFAEASRIQQNELRALTDGLRTRPLRYPTAVTVRRQVGIVDDAVDHAWMLSPWGLQAWLEMSFPDKPIRVGPDPNVRQSRTHWNLVLIPGERR